MISNNIEVLTIPSHTSHLLQALDLVPFAQFKKCWKHNLCKYNNTHSGCPLNKVDFWDVFIPSWNQAMVPKNIIAGFWHTGIYPFDPTAIPKTIMAPSLVTHKENGEGRLVLKFCYTLFKNSLDIPVYVSERRTSTYIFCSCPCSIWKGVVLLSIYNSYTGLNHVA